MAYLRFERNLGDQSMPLTNLDSDQSFNSARSAAVFYRHTELLAHVWFQEMGVSYPGGAKDAAATESLDSYCDW
jgi:hypothetical protein